MSKYKPKSKYRILTAYWWNPIFWIVVFGTPFYYGAAAFFKAIPEVIKEFKSWDLR